MVTYPQTPKEFADDIMVMIDMGADIVGGCCGTNSDFIKEIASRLK